MNTVTKKSRKCPFRNPRMILDCHSLIFVNEHNDGVIVRNIISTIKRIKVLYRVK